ncbi:FAD-dependent monooxygenase [Kitasatospora sp. NRRL B-11411]|uniref:FAD-dependent monooxygenase n=1 Tax=Kitasatospora sp. NRRL B-11411 TaxID=1463822 RepID=UPI0004C30CFD|nr:FAD-dependent monooxygenase [Kitasatospora sp. NRRL B-11411]
MTTTVDTLVIGAGPAGLVAADRLAENGTRVLLVDAGRPYQRRACPVDLMRTCNGCKGICNVISGFGGSIHYGDGVKLSQFPSGRRLAELLGTERADALADQAVRRLCGTEQPVFRGAVPTTGPFKIKDYPVASLSADQVRALIERLHSRITAAPNTELRMQTQITSLHPLGQGWRAETAGQAGTSETVHASSVVVAVGRRGQRWWQQALRRLELSHWAPAPSVGVRFEAPTALLRRGSDIHEDFKTTIVTNGVKIKTFCYCVGPGGGRIKFTDYGDHTLLDGHVIPEAKTGSTANFALLAQLRAPDGAPRTTAWVEENLLVPYRKLRTDRPGKPVLQWYPDFRSRSLACTGLEQFAELSGFRPSLRDYQVADLAGILPQDIHTALCDAFEDLMTYFNGTHLSGHAAAQVAVIGLELENLWDELSLTDSLETTAPGLYAAGDCTGLAQGILQAAVGGLAAAEAIIGSPHDATGLAS